MWKFGYFVGQEAKYLGVILAAGVLSVACGSQDDSGTNHEPGSTPGPTKAVNCEGAIAQVASPYTPNNGISDWGGFLVDEHGMVFTAIPDGQLTDDTEPYPPMLMSGDLNGNLKTIYTSETGMITNFVMDEEYVYFSVVIGSSQLLKVPRNGGEPTVLVDDGVWTGPMSDGKRLYYEGKTDKFHDGLFAIEKTGGTPTLLTDRGDKMLFSSTMEGDTIYFIDSDGVLSDTDNTLYEMSVTTGAIERMTTLPGSASGGLQAVNGAVYSTLLSDDLDIETYRLKANEAPVLVEPDSGLPLVFRDGYVYYPSRSSGITRNTLGFDGPTVVPGSAGKSIYAIAVGPTDLWYAAVSCIYRANK